LIMAICLCYTLILSPDISFCENTLETGIWTKAIDRKACSLNLSAILSH